MRANGWTIRPAHSASFLILYSAAIALVGERLEHLQRARKLGIVEFGKLDVNALQEFSALPVGTVSGDENTAGDIHLGAAPLHDCVRSLELLLRHPRVAATVVVPSPLEGLKRAAHDSTKMNG